MKTIDKARVDRLSATLADLRIKIDELEEKRSKFSCGENRAKYDHRIQKFKVKRDKAFGIRALIYRKYGLTSKGREPSDPNKWDWQES